MDKWPPITTVHLEQIAAGLTDDPDLLAFVAADQSLSNELEQIRRDNELMSEFVCIDPGTPAHEFDPIAGYELLEEIHRGGQGIVQRARQRSADRMVAIKTLLQGAFASDSQRHRFEREVRLIARLDHPSIVTVHESGRTALGSHYIVMQLIDGVPVDQFCAKLREANDLRGIVRVFVGITEAVRYAHQRGVIHRDLKPGNILIDRSGVPHILDFGIARAFGNDSHTEPMTTRTGEFVGTLSFASPEQIASDPDLVDVRSDVYSMGILLYQALTGERPINVQGALAEVIARIASEVPPLPSSINPSIDRDLDTITRKALEKRVNDRYQTAGELNRDLDAWLHGRAISARAHDVWYVACKMLLRHRVPVSIALIFLVVIVGFSITTGVLAIKFQRENRDLNSTVRGLGGALSGIDRETSPTPVNSLTDFLSLLVENIRSEVGDRSDIESAVRDAAGIAYMDERDTYPQADFQLNRAYELRLQSLTPPHRDLATSLHNLGRLRFKQRRLDEAETYYRQALAMREALYGSEHADVAWTMHHLAFTLQEEGKREESFRYWKEALRVRRAVLEPTDSNIANTLSGLATNHLARGDNAAAAEALRDALAIVLVIVPDDARTGPDSLPVGRIEHNLGIALGNLGEYEESRRVLEDAIRIKNMKEPGSIHLARSHAALGRVLLRMGLIDEAEAEVRQAHMMIENGAVSSDSSIDAILLMAEIELAKSNLNEADLLVREALGTIPSGHPASFQRDRGEILSVLAHVLAAQCRHEDAIATAQQADDILRNDRPDSDPRTLANIRLLAQELSIVGRTTESDAVSARVQAAERTTAATNTDQQP